MGATGQLADDTYEDLDSIARFFATSKLHQHRYDSACTYAAVLLQARQQLSYALLFPYLKTYRDRYRANAKCDRALKIGRFYACMAANRPGIWEDI